MSRKPNCLACLMHDTGVKGTVVLPHTCGKIPMRQEMEMPEKEIKHQWVEGEWKKDGRYQVKDDKCSLCGCVRTWMKFWCRGSLVKDVAHYERSKILFGERDMPSCWGGPNPV